MTFVRLTDKRKQLILNVAQIESVVPCGDGARIRLAVDPSGMSNSFVNVQESFEQIAALLGCGVEPEPVEPEWRTFADERPKDGQWIEARARPGADVLAGHYRHPAPNAAFPHKVGDGACFYADEQWRPATEPSA